jgi:hypothetical protein
LFQPLNGPLTDRNISTAQTLRHKGFRALEQAFLSTAIRPEGKTGACPSCRLWIRPAPPSTRGRRRVNVPAHGDPGSHCCGAGTQHGQPCSWRYLSAMPHYSPLPILVHDVAYPQQCRRLSSHASRPLCRGGGLVAPIALKIKDPAELPRSLEQVRVVHPALFHAHCGIPGKVLRGELTAIGLGNLQPQDR